MEKKMGHKGVSKRKPKKVKSSSNDNASGFSNTRPGESPTVQSLVKDKGDPLNRGGAIPFTSERNKKNRKGK
jgi:hypothetical protein